jgi:4-carboxymuconolactone decarboxylase
MVDNQSVARGLETYHRLFGETDIDIEPDKTERKGLRFFTIAHLFANIWSREEQLLMRDRSMITVALLAQQGRDPELIKHIQGALNQNISPDQLLEIMIQVAHYGGWAAGHNGQRITEEVLKIRKELVTLNEYIGKAEKEGNITFLTRILNDSLVFYRASGEAIGKE